MGGGGDTRAEAVVVIGIVNARAIAIGAAAAVAVVDVVGIAAPGATRDCLAMFAETAAAAAAGTAVDRLAMPPAAHTKGY